MEDFINNTQWTTSQCRQLCSEEVQLLNKQDEKLVNEFKSNKLEKEAKKMWDLFYKRNSTNFFKDRHWTTREFEEINTRTQMKEKTILLEVGCGVGNAIFPLLDEKENIFIYACDFSPRAIKFIKDNERYDPKRCSAFECDLTSQSLEEVISPSSVDIVTCIFVLSAIHPDKFLFVLKNIQKILKPGGRLLFRDYGLHDWAMFRFNPGSKISENFYVRQDGTRAYYFNKDDMQRWVEDAGYDIVSNDYVMRETINKKKDLSVPRVFLQGKYKKR